MQLAAYGAQDIYLTGNPQITFFKFVYKRHTNFAMESIKQTLNGNVDFGQDISYKLERNGDLVHKMFLEFYVSGFGGSDRICANLGSAIIDHIDLKIGGQLIDRHYGHWLEVYANLTEPCNNIYNSCYIENDGNLRSGNIFQGMSCMGGVQGNTSMNDSTRTFWVPLQFWFCRHPGLSLPLIALQYHEVNIDITFQQRNYCTDGGNAKLNCDLWCNYIYLDTDERRRFVQEKYEYLIEQVQFNDSLSSTKVELQLNHPVKELIWTGGVTLNTDIDKSEGPSTPLALSYTNSFKLLLNGEERFVERKRDYFTQVQIWMYHTGQGGRKQSDDYLTLHNIDNDKPDIGLNNSIAVYSFALKPEEQQPSGTCNFSRIDNAHLILKEADALYIYAVNYNVLRIMNGMAGLVYSN